MKIKDNIHATALLRKGGKWLSATRSWIQNNCINGDRVTWGSNEILFPRITIRMLEEVASEAAAAAVNEYIAELQAQKDMRDDYEYFKSNNE